MEQEKKYKYKAIAISAVIHGALLLLFFLVLAWKEPNPPIPEYGIELNFGIQPGGSGSTQPESTRQVVSQVSEEVEDDMEESVEETEITENDEAAFDSEPTDAEEVTDEISDEISDDENSADVASARESSAEATSNSSRNAEGDNSHKNDDPPSKSSTASTKNAEETNAVVTHGNDHNPGDQGDPKGSIDSRAIMGATSGGSGASLEMSGWTWDFKPDPKEKSDEGGKIVFQVTIDDEGYIIKVVTLEKTVTPAVEKVYKDEVRKLTFSKTADYKPAPSSKGKITFIIKSN